jgi:hypothetical protein
MQLWFLLYPSLFWTFLILLPIGIATNWAKKNLVFDWPKGWTEASPSSSSYPSSTPPYLAASPAGRQPLTTPFNTYPVNGNGNGNGSNYSSRNNSIDVGSYHGSMGNGSGFSAYGSSGTHASGAVNELQSCDSVTVHINPAGQPAAGVDGHGYEAAVVVKLKAA